MKKPKCRKQEDAHMSDLYAAEKAKTLKINRISLLSLLVLFIGSVTAFALSLIHRLGEFTIQPDGSFPVAHWLDWQMVTSSLASILFLVFLLTMVNVIFPNKIKAQEATMFIVSLGLLIVSIAGVTKLMDSVSENNLKSWAKSRYGIEFDTVQEGFKPAVMGAGGCQTNYNPFGPSGLKYNTSCDIKENGRSTYILVSKEGRYMAELLESGIGYKAFPTVIKATLEELPTKTVG
jgi:hypothetical protein